MPYAAVDVVNRMRASLAVDRPRAPRRPLRIRLALLLGLAEVVGVFVAVALAS